MAHSPSRAPTLPGVSPTRCYGLQYLEGEMLSLVGVAAGLRPSLTLSTCCVNLRDTLASPALDGQLFGRLYAALAAVDDPLDAFLQSPPRRNATDRRGIRQPYEPVLRSTTTVRSVRQLHRPATRPAGPPPYPPEALAEEPESSIARKRARSSPGPGVSAHNGVAGGTDTGPSEDVPGATPLPGGCFSPKLLSGDVAGGVFSGSADARRKSWKMRLKGDLVTCRKPSESFSFSGQRRGKQDVLMEVVASNPPVVAVTCTTELSLFSLDGERLPVVTVQQQRWKQRQRRWQNVEGACQERDSSGFDASAAVGAVDVAGGGGATAAAVDVAADAGAAGTASAARAAAASGGGEPESFGANYKWQRERGFSTGESVYERDRESADDEEEEGLGEAAAVAAEIHQRDIRCLTASPAGDMVATGSLDCTIRVRSVPTCDWVRRLRGHESGVRCIAFHRTGRLVSADSLGMMAVWDVYPVSQRLQTMQGHSDSVQVLTWTGGGKRLASGALDGSIVVWSVSAEGDALDPVFRYGGFCHPYRLVAVGRCLAFSSSELPTVDALFNGPPSHVASFRDTTTARNQGYKNGHHDGGINDSPLLAESKGAHISVVDVDSSPSLGVAENPGCARVATGLGRLQHLVAGASIGSVALSRMESWTADSDSSRIDSDDEDFVYAGGRGITCRAPRLCRVLGAARVTSFGQFPAAGVESRPGGGGGDGGGGGGSALEAVWVSVSRYRWLRPARETAPRHDSMHSGGLGGGKPSATSSSRNGNHDDDDDDSGEDLDAGALCTCATFVGRTLFLGYDTGDIWAHRAFDGRRIYRLSTLGSLARLTEAEGSLFAYSASGVISRWSWRDDARYKSPLDTIRNKPSWRQKC